MYTVFNEINGKDVIYLFIYLFIFILFYFLGFNCRENAGSKHDVVWDGVPKFCSNERELKMLLLTNSV